MSLPGERRPPTDAAPHSRVIVAARDRELAARIAVALGDELTSVSTIVSPMEMDALASPPDVLIVDVAMAELATLRGLLRVRRRWPVISIVAVNVRTEPQASQLLDWGADDAILTDCAWTHVAARLGAATRRARTVNAARRSRVGDIVYDRGNRRVWCGDEEIAFAPRELAVLDCLWARAGQVVRQESLYDFVWPQESDDPRTNRVEVYISYVRRKLRRSNQVAIETLRGAGYRLVQRVRENGTSPGKR